jgi:hypothetical protein
MIAQRALQALSRLKAGTMNKTEAAYAATLDARRYAGEVAWFKFEGVKLRLADNTFYTSDFAVMLADGALEVHEVKGFWTDDGRRRSRSLPIFTRFDLLRFAQGRKRKVVGGQLNSSSKVGTKISPGSHRQGETKTGRYSRVLVSRGPAVRHFLTRGFF